MSGRQLILSFPRIYMNPFAATQVIASLMFDAVTVRVRRLGWDPEHSVRFDPYDFDDSNLPWRSAADAALERAEDCGYGPCGLAIEVNGKEAMLGVGRRVVEDPGFTGVALVWWWLPGQRTPMVNADSHVGVGVQWNIWPEGDGAIGVEIAVDVPDPSIGPRPDVEWGLTTLAEKAVQAFAVDVCAEIVQPRRLYASLEPENVLSSLEDGGVFVNRLGRFVALSSKVIKKAHPSTSIRSA